MVSFPKIINVEASSTEYYVCNAVYYVCNAVSAAVTPLCTGSGVRCERVLICSISLTGLTHIVVLTTSSPSVLRRFMRVVLSVAPCKLSGAWLMKLGGGAPSKRP